jgi:hypothetical protein
LPADLVGQAGGVEGGELAAVAGADPAQDQGGVGPGLPGGRTRPPAILWRPKEMAGPVAAGLADLGGVVVEDVAAGQLRHPFAPAEGWVGRWGSGAAPLLARRPPGRGCGRARAHSPDTRRSTSHAAGARRRARRSGVSGSVAGSGRIGSASDDLLKARGARGRDGSRPPRPHCSPGQNGGSSLNSPLPLALPLPVARSGLAVAHRSEGPTSSAWTSTTLRRSPSGVSQERARS